MPTRRTFLLSTAIASAAHAPIARLRNRRSEAKPITTAERQSRIERARELMTANRLGVICLAGGSSLRYFSGVHWGNSERLFMMFLPVRGEPLFVCPGFEEERAVEKIASGIGKTQVYTWQEDENPYTVAASCLKERGLLTSSIGIEERVPFVFADGLAKAAPQATVSSATAVTAGCRMIKSPSELALMRLASSVTLQAYEAAWRSVREGMTEAELANLVGTALQALGFPGEVSVQAGEFSALPHGSEQPQRIREGAMVIIDDGCEVEGYQSDITRALVLGKPSQRMYRVFDIVRKAQNASLSAARPGVPCQAVDAAARRVIAEAGYGPGYKYFTHRLGHGIGLDGHEWPYLVQGNDLPLAAHMTFSNEPGIYIPGQFGIRLEDDMHITENGAELFTPQSPSLDHPFGSA